MNIYYTFIASDPEQDYLFYSIHWGDTKVDLIGPFDSDEIVKFAHTWNDVPSGNYSIGTYAIDRYNDLGEWGFLEYKITKNKIIFQNSILFKQLLMILNTFINMN